MVGKIKALEQKPQAIDAELLQVFSDPERRFGVRAPGDWLLRSRLEPLVMMPWDPRCHQGASEFGAEGWQGPAAVSTYPCLTLDNT
jgi:hypothetical protein